MSLVIDASNGLQFSDNSTFPTSPTGEVCFFAMSAVPSGFLECNGAAVSRTTYSRLFAVLQTTWGSGDNSTTFNLPDLRGQFIRGWDHGKGTDSGRTFASPQTDTIQGHTHILQTWTVAGGNGGYAVGTNGTGTYGSGGLVGGITTDGTNGTPRTAVETRPLNYALMPCIRF